MSDKFCIKLLLHIKYLINNLYKYFSLDSLGKNG